MPVADDEQQLPMFPDANPRESLLFRLLEHQAEAVRILAAANHVLMQNALESPQGRRIMAEVAAEVTPRSTKRRHQPQNKELRDWGGFRAYFQRLERVVRGNNRLGPDDEVTKEMVYAVGGPSAKTITRIMVETYDLKPDHWPPSTWPADSPRQT